MKKRTLLLTSLALSLVGTLPQFGNAATLFKIYLQGIAGTGTTTTSDTSGSSSPAPPDPNGPTSILLNACDGKYNVGPTMAGCQTSYASNWPGTSFSITNGIQHWTVPVTGTYTLIAQGAAGSNSINGNAGGMGAYVRITLPLVAGQVLDMAVGQQGASLSAGGGASTIASGGAPLVVAAGGGGAAQNGAGGAGNTQNLSAGYGTAGTGAEAGAGFYYDAPSAPPAGQAMAFVDGAAGSTGGTGGRPGGFGGGGGAGLVSSVLFGGGGGGFNGGNSGGSANYAGSGGRSYWSTSALTSASSKSVSSAGSIQVALN